MHTSCVVWEALTNIKHCAFSTSITNAYDYFNRIPSNGASYTRSGPCVGCSLDTILLPYAVLIHNGTIESSVFIDVYRFAFILVMYLVIIVLVNLSLTIKIIICTHV